MKRHSFDPVSFLFGALFLAVGISIVVGDGSIFGDDARWFWPVVIIVLGLVVTVSSLWDRSG